MTWKDQVATAVWTLREADAEEEKLRMQVVTSPDRRKSNLLKERLRKVQELNAAIWKRLLAWIK
jgi:hypothetical protein